MRGIIFRLFAIIALASCYGAYAESTGSKSLQALKQLSAYKSVGTEPTSVEGWLPAYLVDTAKASQPVCVLNPSLSESLIVEQIRAAKIIYLKAYFLGNAKIIEAIAYAKRVNNAIAICILEDKVSASNYIAPDYLTQNGVFLFYPRKHTRVSGCLLVLDNIAYALTSFNFAENPNVIQLDNQRAISEAKISFLSLLNTCDMSDYTKMRQPNAMRVITHHLTN